MNSVTADGAVRSAPCPRCLLCESPGHDAYRDISDLVFGSPGKWTLKRCTDPKCGLLWLDPMPVQDDLPKLYEDYYTHGGDACVGAESSADWHGTGVVGKLYRSLLRVTGIEHQRNHLARMCLSQHAPGKVLDVGCGNGDLMLVLQKLGWQVEGQDVDPRACDTAQSKTGAVIHAGPLNEMALSDCSYDAIVMNHVIEHVPNPEAVLTKCWQLLKPGGWLVATTPNARSLGLRRFGKYWRGLEVPRHLCVFTPKALEKVARDAGFENARVWTNSARSASMALASIEMRDKGQYRMGSHPGVSRALAKALLFYQPLFLLGNLAFPLTGEECVLEAVK